MNDSHDLPTGSFRLLLFSPFVFFIFAKVDELGLLPSEFRLLREAGCGFALLTRSC